jgi:hypothetical protein
MGREIARCLGVYYLFCLPAIILIALMSKNIIQNDSRVHVFPLIVAYISS